MVDNIPLDISQALLACIDTETTGIDISTALILELGLVRYHNGRERDAHAWFSDPKCLIPAEATAVNHITDEMIAGAPTMEQLAPRVLATVRNCDALLGYNILGYDLPLLQLRMNDSACPVWHKPVIDVMVILKALGGPKQKGYYRLDTQCAKYEIVNYRPHRALGDCWATGELFYKILSEMAFAGWDMSLDGIAAKCREEFDKQQASYNAWKARQTAR